MRRGLSWAGLAASVALCALAGISQSGGQEEGEPFAWETDLAAATVKARDEGRPLLVVFR